MSHQEKFKSKAIQPESKGAELLLKIDKLIFQLKYFYLLIQVIPMELFHFECFLIAIAC